MDRMTSMLAISTTLLVLVSDTAYSAPAGSNSDQHPTLSQMWTAVVKEAEVGVVYESENFVSDHEVTPENPCAKWTNYTDGSCQRLIHQPEGRSDSAKRYLLGCESVDCCIEDGDGPVEYQIPNVHPFAKVTSTGRHTISLFNDKTVTADGWNWKFSIENFTAYTTPTVNNSQYATLVQWDVVVEGDVISNQYVNYTIIPDSERATWAMNYQIPDQCKAPNTPKCGNLFKAGKLSKRSLNFVRSGTLPGHVNKVIKSLSA